MSGVTGGMNYGTFNSGSGGYSGDNKYDSYNSKNYSGKSNNNYGNNEYGGLGTYGDYNYGKSTLDKYKNDK